MLELFFVLSLLASQQQQKLQIDALFSHTHNERSRETYPPKSLINKPHTQLLHHIHKKTQQHMIEQHDNTDVSIFSSPLNFFQNCDDDDDEHIITSHTHSSYKSPHRQFILITTSSISSTTKLMQRFGSILRVSYLSRRYVFYIFRIAHTHISSPPNHLDIHTISIYVYTLYP